MKISPFLYVKKDGTVRVSLMNKANTSPDEVCFKLNLEVPDSLFNRPMAEATIKIKEPASSGAEVLVELDAVTDWLKT